MFVRFHLYSRNHILNQRVIFISSSYRVSVSHEHGKKDAARAVRGLGDGCAHPPHRRADGPAPQGLLLRAEGLRATGATKQPPPVSTHFSKSTSFFSRRRERGAKQVST